MLRLYITQLHISPSPCPLFTHLTIGLRPNTFDGSPPTFTSYFGALRGVLANLQSLTLLEGPNTDDGIDDFGRALAPIFPKLHTFKFTPQSPSTFPRMFDPLFRHFTSIQSLTLDYGCYTSLSFIHTLPTSCTTLELFVPDELSGWNEHPATLATELVLVRDNAERSRRLDVVLHTYLYGDWEQKGWHMLQAQLRLILGVVTEQEGWKESVDVFVAKPELDFSVPLFY